MYIVRVKKRPIECSKIYFLLILLFCMNLLGRGSIFCLLFGLFALTKMPRKIKADMCTAWTLLLTLSVAFTSYIYSDIVEVIKSFNFFLMYLAGTNGYHAAKDKKKYLKSLLFAVFAGYALLVCLTYFRNLSESYIKGHRVLINIWTGKPISVTLIGLVSSVVIGYFFYAFFCQKGKKLKIIASFVMIIVFLVNARSATRTPFLLFAVVMSIMWFIRYVKDQRSGRALKYVTGIIAVAIFGMAFIAVDAFGIRTYIESTAIFERFMEEGTDTPRTKQFMLHLRYMLDYPWGGSFIEKKTGETPHNFLQQGHDMYGIFATIALIMLSFSFAKNIYVLIKRKNKKDVDYLLLSMYLAMTIQSMLEPVFTGYPCLIFSLLLMHGTANEYLRMKRVEG